MNITINQNLVKNYAKLQELYNENKCNFRLKENTIKNIICRRKNNSLKFTKYSAIKNKFNKNGELILYDYTNITCNL